MLELILDNAEEPSSDIDLGHSPSPDKGSQRGTPTIADRPSKPTSLKYPPLASKADSSTRARKMPDMNSHPASSPTLTALPKHLLGNGSSAATKRPKTDTAHTKAVAAYRKARMEKVLRRQLHAHQARVRKARVTGDRSLGMMLMNRIRDLDDTYDTEDEKSWGPGGLVPNSQDLDDFGEEAARHHKSINRLLRRLYRQEEGTLPPKLVFRPERPKDTSLGQPGERKKRRRVSNVGKSSAKKPKIMTPHSNGHLEAPELPVDAPSDDESLSDGISEGLHSTTTELEGLRAEEAIA